MRVGDGGLVARHRQHPAPIMMNQETFVKIEDLHKQGWTIKEIAAETGFHPSTVSRRLRQGLPPRGRAAPDGAKVMTRRWSEAGGGAGR